MPSSTHTWPVEPALVREIVARALAEDIGAGDITSRACVPPDLVACGEVIGKEAGIVSGLYVAGECFRQVSQGTARWEAIMWEGDEFGAGDVLARVCGPARELLAAERTALNFLQRLCGIATLTRRYVDAVEGTSCRILDTRKTTPGLRALEKAAVRAGGGHNHRFALYDGLLIKDNHIAVCGGISNAIARARRVAPPTAAIEVEVQDFDQLDEALQAGADVIMLDNMSVEEVRQAVGRIAGRARVEASGGISPDNARAYAMAGVDFISAGSLTHSAPAVDLSLELQLSPGGKA